MVDFNKLRDPEYKKTMKERLAKQQEVLTQKDRANKHMCKVLMEMIDNEKIDNEYDVEFIQKVNGKLKFGIPLSEKQEAYLEKCFNIKY